MNFCHDYKLVTVLFILTLFFTSCGTSGYKPVEEDITPTETVAPDGELETVTWNIEWFGSGFSGPDDQDLQTENIVKVLDSLKADLYAFQEVANQESLSDILEYLTGYKGFVAEHVSQQQKMAFVYNTQTIDSISAGPVNNVGDEYQDNWTYYWANGREPLYFEFTYTYENRKMDFYAINIHAKSNYGESTEEYEKAYERRKMAAEGLYNYLITHKPDANIILLGDYNDDVDESIFYYDEPGNWAETPYLMFVEDEKNFDILTKKFSDSGQSASIHYEDIIDHITISDELFDYQIDNSTEIIDAQSLIPDYGTTTSDHLPVWTTFEITNNN